MIFLTLLIVAERNYHIFYQMCSSAFPEMQSKS
jgi:myosin heavy subunit